MPSRRTCAAFILESEPLTQASPDPLSDSLQPVPAQALLDRSLQAARDTRFLIVQPGARHETARLFVRALGDGPARIVADERTLEAAGHDVLASLQRAGIACEPPFLFDPQVTADLARVERLQSALAMTGATPVAVGSGTINDLAKLAAHRLGRPYMVVATAASMDGYTAFGASITDRGSKQTFDCPAPRAVLADLEVIAQAPPGMNASGYADLLAKSVAGADWILADALGEEPILPDAWSTVQDLLPHGIAAPGNIARGDPDALRRLTVGLLMSGFAMQAARSSRPASGAEHQFSHLWDMQHHRHQGATPSHGFKVGIGTLASLALYEVLLRQDFGHLDIDAAVSAWPPLERFLKQISAHFGPGELADKAALETRAKHPPADALRAQLERLRAGWPLLRERLIEHLRPFRNAGSLLAQAGCPTEPESIGIPRARLRSSYEQAYFIRHRFTVLDFARRAGVFDAAVDELFASGGAWAALC